VAGKLPGGVQPLERRRPGPGLLADIIVSKYSDHLPLNRQEEIFKRHGALVPKQRMSDWVIAVAEMLSPLGDALLKEILTHPYVQADETSVLVQDRTHKDNMVTGWFWAVHKPPDLIYYRYADTRASEVPKEIFKEYEGLIQTDAYVGYDPIYLPDKCTRVACMAHVRRKFVEVEKLASKECASVLRMVADLYRIESNIKKLNPEEKLKERQLRSVKILNQMQKYLLSWHSRTLPKSPVLSAINYALNQWQEILAFASDGTTEIDNNSVERMMRPIAVGRNNWLFAGSHGGASNAALFFSLINSCKLNKVNSYDYLRDVITRIDSHPNKDIASLLPHRWSKS
jgi:transposase